MFFLFLQQRRSTQRCITPVSSLSHTLHLYVSWSWRISRYVTSCGVNRWVFQRFIFYTSVLTKIKFSTTDVSIHYFNRFLGAHQWCKGNGGPSSAQPQLQESLWGSEPARFVLRSNRSEPDGRRPACWSWCSLFLPCATCPSACSTSWKGKYSFAASKIKSYSNEDAVIDMVHILHLFFPFEAHHSSFLFNNDWHCTFSTDLLLLFFFLAMLNKNNVQYSIALK